MKTIQKKQNLINLPAVMTKAEYRAVRERLGLTQSELAARLGVTRETVTRRETGAAKITQEAAIALRSLCVPLNSPERQKSTASQPNKFL